MSESLTLFERTFPIDVINWPRSESMCSGGQNTHCTKYTYDGKGKIHQSFGVDKAVTAGQNFSVSKTSRTVSSASQKPVQVTVTLVMEETETVYAPEVVWVESCPFSKDEGKNGRGMYQSGRNANHHPRRQGLLVHGGLLEI